jgi:hypothetical protein
LVTAFNVRTFDAWGITSGTSEERTEDGASEGLPVTVRVGPGASLGVEDSGRVLGADDESFVVAVTVFGTVVVEPPDNWGSVGGGSLDRSPGVGGGCPLGLSGTAGGLEVVGRDDGLGAGRDVSSCVGCGGGVDPTCAPGSADVSMR